MASNLQLLWLRTPSTKFRSKPVTNVLINLGKIGKHLYFQYLLGVDSLNVTVAEEMGAGRGRQTPSQMCGTLTLPCLSLIPLGKWFLALGSTPKSTGELKKIPILSLTTQILLCSRRRGPLVQVMVLNLATMRLLENSLSYGGRATGPHRLPLIGLPCLPRRLSSHHLVTKVALTTKGNNMPRIRYFQERWSHWNNALWRREWNRSQLYP